MTHPRTLARQRAAEVLPALLPNWTYRRGAFRPGDAADLPVYEIATPVTDISRESTDDQDQEITLEICLRCAGSHDVFDRLDEISAPIEAAVTAALEIDFAWAELTKVEAAPATTGPEPVGLMLLTFKIRAQVAIGNPNQGV